MNILEVLKMMSEYGFFKFHEKLRKIYLIQLKKKQRYSDYTSRRASFVANEIMNEFSKRNVEDTNLLLIDLGCGNGIIEKYIFSCCKESSALHNLRIVCIDLNVESLTNEWLGGDKCERIVAFLPFIPLRNRIANFIVMSEIIEHLPKDLSILLLKRVYEMLSNGGVLIITTPNISNYFSRVRALLMGNFDLFDPQHFQYLNFNKLRVMLEEVGFKVIIREHFDLVMDKSGVLSKFALLIPSKIRKMLLKILPELDKLVVVKVYKKLK